MPKKTGIAIVAVGAVLILSALLLFLHNRQEDVQAGQEAESLLENVEAVIEMKTIKVPVISTQPDAAPSATPLDPQMPVVMLDGYEYVGYECKRHHDTPRIRLQNEQGNPTPICEIKPVGQSKLELMASQIFERVWGDQREIVLQTCKMLDACYKPDADRRADLMKAKDDSVQLLQQQLDDLVVVRARGEIEQDKFLQRTIEIQQQMEALRQSKAQIASEDYNPGRLDMEAIEAALCEAVEMHDGLVSEDFIDLFVSQVTPLSDSRFAWCLDFSPQPTVAFLNLAGQRKYTTCSMDSKLHFGPFADEEGHTIPFPGSLRR